MTIKKTQLYTLMGTVSLFLLLYYCYMNSLRRYFIPMSSVTVPLILAFVLFSVVLTNDGKIRICGQTDKLLCGTWVLIAAFILIDNYDLASSLASGGVIQLCVMIAFMLFMNRSDSWIEQWLSIAVLFTFINAAATIVFYFNGNLYNQFIKIFFDYSLIPILQKYYEMGYMSGLWSHFSSNGIVLGMGALVIFEKTRQLFNDKEDKKYTKAKKVAYIVCLLVVIYALFLSSKRSPLLAAIAAVVITLLISSGKNVMKRLFIITISCVAVFLLYLLAVKYIPGMDTIANKFMALEDSDAGVLNGRELLWQFAIDMFDKSPILGLGYGSYEALTKSAALFTNTAHNQYLQILSELGFVGLILYAVAFITGVIYSAILIIKLVSNNGDKKDISMLCVSLELQIFVLIYSVTASSLTMYSVLIPYLLACTVPRVINYKYTNKL